MNNAKLIIMSLLAVVFIASACDEESAGPSETVVQLSKLSHEWDVLSVTKDGADMDDYDGFRLILSGQATSDVFAYATSGRPELSPWPSGGVWKFGSTVSTQVIRDAGTDEQVVMTYSVTDTNLSLEFDFAGEGYEAGRINSSEGKWKFQFIRK